MSGLSKIRYLCWTNENREIFAGNETGKITVWDPEKGRSIYVHDAHESAITKMQWFEKSRYLMTASKEKVLNIWEIPKEWINEEAPEEVKKEDEEARFIVKKLKQTLEEQKKEEFEKFEEDDEGKKIIETQTNTQNAFTKMAEGFDPLGGGITKAKTFNQDDDLMGWHK